MSYDLDQNTREYHPLKFNIKKNKFIKKKIININFYINHKYKIWKKLRKFQF